MTRRKRYSAEFKCEAIELPTLGYCSDMGSGTVHAQNRLRTVWNFPMLSSYSAPDKIPGRVPRCLNSS